MAAYQLISISAHGSLPWSNIIATHTVNCQWELYKIQHSDDNIIYHKKCVVGPVRPFSAVSGSPRLGIIPLHSQGRWKDIWKEILNVPLEIIAKCSGKTLK